MSFSLIVLPETRPMVSYPILRVINSENWPCAPRFSVGPSEQNAVSKARFVWGSDTGLEPPKRLMCSRANL